MSATPDSTLADPKDRLIADLQRQLAASNAERDEALEQQTATAEVLQVINASPGNLTPVFDAILEKAMSLCEAAFGFMTIYDGSRFTPAAMRDVPEALAAYFATGMDQPRPGEAHWRLLEGEDLVHNLDQKDEDVYRSGSPLRRAIVDLGGTRTALVVALRKDGVLRGTMTLYRKEVRPFTDKQIALIQNFAAQAVIAMENARLLTETREALDQQTATAEVLQVINSSPGDLAPVFDAILEKAHSLCGTDFGGLLIYNGEHLRAAALHNVPPAFAELAQRPFRPGPKNRITNLMRGESLVHVDDLRDVLAEAPDDPMVRAAVELAGIRTILLVALRKDDALLGVITAYRHEVRPFSDKQIALLQNFAAQAVIAMENARLLTETREALEQQTATTDVLQVINSSPGDLAPVFDSMLEKATMLCEAAFGILSTWDGERFHRTAWRGVPSALIDASRNVPMTPAPGGLIGRFVQGETVLALDDLAENADWIGPGAQLLVQLGGARSYLGAALRRDGVLLGHIAIYRQEVRSFTDKQTALLQNFAAQAVIAMENARLLGELRARTDEVAVWNRELEDRVASQLGELERVGKLKRFLAPQLAELIVARGDKNILETHRRDIVVVFCDLRGFTAFAETAEPEEVLDLLREYHGALGPVVAASEGTLDHFSGDGIMVFFNDPVPVPDASERAVRMAIAMREAMALLQARWRRQGRAIGFGAGIARGYATLGQIGFAERIDYTAIGTVCNLAARLCAEAKDGQILVSRRVAAAVEELVRLEEIGDLALKGLMQAVAVYNIASEPRASDSDETRMSG